MMTFWEIKNIKRRHCECMYPITLNQQIFERVN